jgi:hypothetical protein
MMTALRERPRVVFVQVLGLIALLAVGVVVGMALKPDPSPKTPASVQRRLDGLESEQRTTKAALVRAERTQAGQARTIRVLRRRVRTDSVRIARFRRALAKASG